ncbi:MAG: diguanylate cyclase [Desulfobulbaceae bacterium]|nr:MAG: diguanylate cyclase [Desulfobulbaceae bacterium]
MPESQLEKRRFSHFYNDGLAGFYNEDYLKVVLQQNQDSYEYKSMNAIHLKNLSKCNKRKSWGQGDLLLKMFAEDIQSRYPKAMIFRVYGNNFAILSRERSNAPLQNSQ